MRPETMVATMTANGIHLYVNDAGDLRHRGKRGQGMHSHCIYWVRFTKTAHRLEIPNRADPGGFLPTVR